MNEMIYLAHLTKLNECTKVKDAQEYVREFNSMLKADTKLLNPYSNPICDEKTIKFIYKLYIKSINVHTKLSRAFLPDFLYNDAWRAQKLLLEYILTNEAERSKNRVYNTYEHPFTRLLSYEEFMDIFEFNSVIKLPTSSYFVEQLNTIIGDNSIHFDIEFNYDNDSFDKFSTSISNVNVKDLIYAIRYKQVNFPNKEQTVWDKFIIYLISEANNYKIKQEQFDESIIKLEQQINALKEVKELYNGKS